MKGASGLVVLAALETDGGGDLVRQVSRTTAREAVAITSAHVCRPAPVVTP